MAQADRVLSTPPPNTSSFVPIISAEDRCAPPFAGGSAALQSAGRRHGRWACVSPRSPPDWRAIDEQGYRLSEERRAPVESAADSPETKRLRRRGGRNRNPLRRLHSFSGLAVTIAGKIHRGEPLRVDSYSDERKWLRDEDARRLADELARLVQEMEAGQ